MQKHSQDDGPARPVRLTPRERQIADQLAAGLTYKEIAEELGISFHTVASHVKSVLQKTGATSSRKLAAGIRRGR